MTWDRELLLPRTTNNININARVVLKYIGKSLDTMGISVSIHTIQRCLERDNKPCHIVARFNFAKTFLDKGNCFGEKVLWSDETNIEPFRHNDVQKIWRKKCEALLLKNTVSALKHGGSSMMFWDCFISKNWIIAVRWITKSEKYTKILDKNLQLSSQNLDLGQRFTFQIDNDPKHMSISVTAWPRKNKITVPPCSFKWVPTWII